MGGIAQVVYHMFHFINTLPFIVSYRNVIYVIILLISDKKTVKSFLTYANGKSKQWFAKTRKNKSSMKMDDVVISLGMLIWSEKDLKLKPIRGKRLALRVPPEIGYESLREKAYTKWKNYHPESTIIDIEYVLCFESGDKAMNLPGTSTPFNLRTYKEEVGKDYKRIVLYLCSVSDRTIAEKALVFDIDESSTSSDVFDGDDIELPLLKRVKKSEQEEQDEIFAKELQEKFNDDFPFIEEEEEILPNFLITDINCSDTPQKDSVKTSTISEILMAVSENVKTETQFFLNVRRNSSIQRILSLWSRQSLLVSPEGKLRIKYVGEDGIDSGAVAKEFLTNAIENIGEYLFSNGAPKDSMSDIQNGNFLCSGQIIAVSLVEGGPPPQFLHKSVFDMLVDNRVDLKQLDIEKHFVPADREVLAAIRNNPIANSDTVIDYGYTGVIDINNVDRIIETVMISIISRRITYLGEVAKGLELFNLLASVRQHKVLFEKHFVKEDADTTKIDANYIISILHPVYSPESSSKRIVEENIVDHLQDFVMELESSNVIGHSSEITTNCDESNEPNSIDETLSYGMEADLSPAGLLGWLTGQKHKPLFGGKFYITMQFDHDCKTRNPQHKICFPYVRACARELLIPTSHIKTYDEFKNNFLLAISKGQAFGMS